MKKNLVIAGLACSNLVLLAALIYVCLKWRAPVLSSSAPTTSVSLVTPGMHNEVRLDEETGPQEFTFTTPGHFAGREAPLIVNRAITITATFDARGKDGVIVAQGGAGHGYALYVQDGELIFALRRLTVLTTVSGGPVGRGRQTVKASLSKAGELSLVRGGNEPVTARAAGMITA